MCKKCTIYEEEIKNIAHVLWIFEVENCNLKTQITFLENKYEKNRNEFTNYKALYSNDNYKVLSQRIHTDLTHWQLKNQTIQDKFLS